MIAPSPSDSEQCTSVLKPASAASFTCFPRRPQEGGVGGLNENPESDDALVPGEPERLLLSVPGLEPRESIPASGDEKAHRQSGDG